MLLLSFYTRTLLRCNISPIYNERRSFFQKGRIPQVRRFVSTYECLSTCHFHIFRHTMKRYFLDYCLPLQLGPLRVFQAEEEITERKFFHEELGQCNRDESIRCLRTRFPIVDLDDHCRAIITSCVARLDNIIGFRVKGSMVHYPEQRRALGKKVGITWVRHLPTADHPFNKFRPDTLHPQTIQKCVCSTLSAVLSGTPAHANILVLNVGSVLGQLAPDGQFAWMWTSRKSGIDDLFAVTVTDTKLLARRLGVNIYGYYIGRGDDPTLLITYSCNHRGPSDRGINLSVRCQGFTDCSIVPLRD